MTGSLRPACGDGVGCEAVGPVGVASVFGAAAISVSLLLWMFRGMFTVRKSSVSCSLHTCDCAGLPMV